MEAAGIEPASRSRCRRRSDAGGGAAACRGDDGRWPSNGSPSIYTDFWRYCHAVRRHWLDGSNDAALRPSFKAHKNGQIASV